MPDNGDPQPADDHWLGYGLRKIPEIFIFSVRLITHPIRMVLARLGIGNDWERIKQAVLFFTAMMGLWFVVEVPIFLFRGIKAAILGGVLFFAFQLVAYFLVSTLYAFILHMLLKIFGVKTNLFQTISCYFYTAIALPLYAILIYPRDLVKYWTIDRAGKIEIILDPRFDQIQAEVLRQLGTAWQGLFHVSGVLVGVLSIVVFLLLSVILSKWYQASYWKCLGATIALYVGIWIFEQRVLEYVSGRVEVLFAKMG